MKYKAVLPLILFVSLGALNGTTKKTKTYALIRYPVVDLFSSAAIPTTVSAATRTPTPCLRIHQALFNEVFEIEQTEGQATALIIPWARYGYDAQGKAQARYWVSNNDIIVLSKICIPDFHNALPFFNSHTVTLKKPLLINKVTYSVGTQFVRTFNDTADDISIKYIDSVAKNIQHCTIPRSAVLKTPPHPSRKEFVRVLTEFIKDIQSQNPGAIPYVWGGSSFLRPYSASYTEDSQGFHRAENETVPLAGYDCSNLILRFAHMMNIPYFFKTTSMLEKYGKKLTRHDKLQEGDLIWLQGHVAVITDLANTLILESSGYENSVGRIRIVKLSEFLKNIKTWDDLLKAYRNNQIVVRLDSQGNDYKESPVKIFKLY